jgi:hypothetical protein
MGFACVLSDSTSACLEIIEEAAKQTNDATTKQRMVTSISEES